MEVWKDIVAKAAHFRSRKTKLWLIWVQINLSVDLDGRKMLLKCLELNALNKPESAYQMNKGFTASQLLKIDAD